MKKISDFIKWYCYIAVSILIVCSVIYPLLDVKMISAATLWQILLSALLTTIPTVVIGPEEANTSRGMFFHFILHYFSLCIIMIVCGKWFGWLDFTLSGILMMVIAVAAVYGLVLGIYCVIDWQQAKIINQELRERYQDEKDD